MFALLTMPVEEVIARTFRELTKERKINAQTAAYALGREFGKPAAWVLALCLPIILEVRP